MKWNWRQSQSHSWHCSSIQILHSCWAEIPTLRWLSEVHWIKTSDKKHTVSPAVVSPVDRCPVPYAWIRSVLSWWSYPIAHNFVNFLVKVIMIWSNYSFVASNLPLDKHTFNNDTTSPRALGVLGFLLRIWFEFGDSSARSGESLPLALASPSKTSTLAL
jgi:hypothetical protein